MVADLDDRDTWETLDGGRALAPGDLWAGVAFVDLDSDLAVALTPEDDFYLPARFSLALVVSVWDDTSSSLP